ncbi:MAG: flavin reductase [Oscillospiraceae bacterium]|nr:flavin reductase [Oscillospiraceae bacterium]
MDNKALYSLSYGLFVLSARDGDKDNGCIINTAQQAAGNPLLMSVAVNKANYTTEIIAKTGQFNLSVLDESAPFSLFQCFGFRSGRDCDKFADIDFARSPNGLCYLPQHTAAYMSCKVVNTVDLGSHTMFIATVPEAECLSSFAPMTYAYYHANVKNAPAPAKKTGWVCKICGYVYEGETLPADFVCPLCKHPAADFEKLG